MMARDTYQAIEACLRLCGHRQPLVGSCCAVQLKLGDAFAVRGFFSIARLGSTLDECRGLTDDGLGVRVTAPASTNPWNAFCINSTEFANASREKMSRCRNTDLGAPLASRSMGDKLT